MGNWTEDMIGDRLAKTREMHPVDYRSEVTKNFINPNDMVNTTCADKMGWSPPDNSEEIALGNLTERTRAFACACGFCDTDVI
jgi:hypothetical protein